MKWGRRVLLMVLACGVAAAVTALVWLREREPSYQGKKLSEWIAAASGFSGLEEQQALEAVRSMGTNAFPFLVKWLTYEQPAWGAKVSSASRGWPQVIQKIVRRLDGERGVFRALDAQECFRLLGPKASAAAPELARLVVGAKASDGSALAGNALVYIGKEALPPVVAELANPRAANRVATVRVILAMSNWKIDVSSAVPVLVDCLRDGDEELRGEAAWALGVLGVQPEVVVPALVSGVSDAAGSVRARCLASLGGFHDQARSALSCVRKALYDPEAEVREEATNAFWGIAPEVLETNKVR